LAHDLVEQLREALRHAQGLAAHGVSERQLTGRALARLSNKLPHEQWVVEDATLRLSHLDGDRIEVRIRQAEQHDFVPAGWTLLNANRPVRELTGAEYLAIQAAFDTIAETLARPLTSGVATSGEHT
jgi:hypothetical protein